jgi:hypothetical protein
VALGALDRLLQNGAVRPELAAANLAEHLNDVAAAEVFQTRTPVIVEMTSFLLPSR